MKQLRFQASRARSLFSTEVLFPAALAGGLAVAVGYLTDQLVVHLGAPDRLLLWWNDVTIGALTFIVALGLTLLVRRARREELARLSIIREVNHHVGNALQVVRLHQAIEGDPEMTAQVDDAINRIEWVLREVLTQVNAPDAAHARGGSRRAWRGVRTRDSVQARETTSTPSGRGGV